MGYEELSDEDIPALISAIEERRTALMARADKLRHRIDELELSYNEQMVLDEDGDFEGAPELMRLVEESTALLQESSACSNEIFALNIERTKRSSTR